MGTAKEAFQKFCFETFIDSDGKQKGSKTTTAEKGAKIIKFLKKDAESSEHSAKFTTGSRSESFSW